MYFSIENLSLGPTTSGQPYNCLHPLGQPSGPLSQQGQKHVEPWDRPLQQWAGVGCLDRGCSSVHQWITAWHSFLHAWRVLAWWGHAPMPRELRQRLYGHLDPYSCTGRSQPSERGDAPSISLSLWLVLRRKKTCTNNANIVSEWVKDHHVNIQSSH